MRITPSAIFALLGLCIPAYSEAPDISGNLRFRSTFFNNFGAYEQRRSTGDQSDLEHQIRADVKLEKELQEVNRAVLQIRGSHRFGDNVASKNFSAGDSLRLHQAYIEFDDLFADQVRLRLGRQEIIHGRQHLIGNNDWSLEGRSFDALRLSHDGPSWDNDLFYALLDDDPSGRKDLQLAGALATHTSIMRRISELYAYHLFQPRSKLIYPSTANREYKILTLGARTEGKISAPLFYQAMFNVQTGRVQDFRKPALLQQDHRAHSFLFQLDYFLNGRVFRNLGVEYSQATGDKLSTPGKHETFLPLFPSDHPRSGAMDWFGLMNSRIATVYLFYDISKKIESLIEWHHFFLDSSGSAWYLGDHSSAWTGGTPAVEWPGNGTSSKSAGSELDFHWRLPAGKSRFFDLGYSIFFPGSMFKDSTLWNNSDKVHWAYIQTSLSF